jgi:catechol 2,3-dioxygenase-like lactoylglutathione lyase family enzyme
VSLLESMWHVCLVTRDLDGTVEWYREVLGFEVIRGR